MLTKNFYFLVIFQPMCTSAVCDLKVKIFTLMFSCGIRRNKHSLMVADAGLMAGHRL